MPFILDVKSRIYQPAAASRWGLPYIVAAVVMAAHSACASHGQADVSPGSGQTITRVTSPVIDTRITSDRRISSHVLTASMQQAWVALVATYQQLEIPVDYADPATQRLGNPTVQSRRIGGERLSRYLECGRASMGRPRADQYDVTYSIFSRLVKDDDGRTVLHTELDGSARPTSVSTNPIQCVSKGTLEQRIADMVSEMLNTGNMIR